MTDIRPEISAVHRTVVTGDSGPEQSRAVLLRRRYEAPIDDVWDACTSPERIARWFLPVTGDLRLGGTYQIEGNAGGEIVRCEPPRLLTVSWLFGDNPAAEVELRLSPDDSQGTMLELQHSGLTDEAFWAQFGPGAVGVGWDLALVGLSLHLSGQVKGDSLAWQQSPAGRGFVTTCSRAWGAAFEVSGATAAVAAAAVRHTTAFYAPAESGLLTRSRMADHHSAGNDAFLRRIVQRQPAIPSGAAR